MEQYNRTMELKLRFQDERTALAKFQQLVDEGLCESIYLIHSGYWASEGYWVESYPYEKIPTLHKLDTTIKIYYDDKIKQRINSIN